MSDNLRGRYTSSLVARLLTNYLDIRSSLDGAAGQHFIEVGTQVRNTIPFRDTQHAKPPNDGKRRAQIMQDLHVACLDIERALKWMSNDDLEYIYKVYLLKTHTLDDMLVEKNLQSRGSMQRRAWRAVQRLTRVLNRE